MIRSISLAFIGICLSASQATASPPTYTIVTLKNGQEIGTRNIAAIELRNATSALVEAFQEQPPSYAVLLSIAKGMTAKTRCFNLYGSRIALASIESGKIDASANAEEFLKGSITSIEQVNAQTQITCEMR